MTIKIPQATNSRRREGEVQFQIQPMRMQSFGDEGLNPPRSNSQADISRAVYLAAGGAMGEDLSQVGNYMGALASDMIKKQSAMENAADDNSYRELEQAQKLIIQEEALKAKQAVARGEIKTLEQPEYIRDRANERMKVHLEKTSFYDGKAKDSVSRYLEQNRYETYLAGKNEALDEVTSMTKATQDLYVTELVNNGTTSLVEYEQNMAKLTNLAADPVYSASRGSTGDAISSINAAINKTQRGLRDTLMLEDPDKLFDLLEDEQATQKYFGTLSGDVLAKAKTDAIKAGNARDERIQKASDEQLKLRQERTYDTAAMLIINGDYEKAQMIINDPTKPMKSSQRLALDKRIRTEGKTSNSAATEANFKELKLEALSGNVTKEQLRLEYGRKDSLTDSQFDELYKIVGENSEDSQFTKLWKSDEVKQYRKQIEIRADAGGDAHFGSAQQLKNKRLDADNYFSDQLRDGVSPEDAYVKTEKVFALSKGTDYVENYERVKKVEQQVQRYSAVEVVGYLTATQTTSPETYQEFLRIAESGLERSELQRQLRQLAISSVRDIEVNSKNNAMLNAAQNRNAKD